MLAVWRCARRSSLVVRKLREGESMEPFRVPIGRRLASISDFFERLVAALRPPEIRSQRMCPFCGLITPRRKACCLECGKSFKPA